MATEFEDEYGDGSLLRGVFFGVLFTLIAGFIGYEGFRFINYIVGVIK